MLWNAIHFWIVDGRVQEAESDTIRERALMAEAIADAHADGVNAAVRSGAAVLVCGGAHPWYGLQRDGEPPICRLHEAHAAGERAALKAAAQWWQDCADDPGETPANAKDERFVADWLNARAENLNAS